MHNILPPGPLLSAFLIASLVLAITPGPGVFYIVTRSIAQGRLSGIASTAGVAMGNLGNAIGASIGLAALFALSSFAFALVKYVGAAYLVYLGVQALRNASTEAIASAHEPLARRKIARDGFIVALFNPKTAVFFAAFLPQFIGANAHPMLQSITLGSLFVLIAATTDTIYVLAASALAPALTRTRGLRMWGRYLTGSAFIGLGVFTAIAGTRAGK